MGDQPFMRGDSLVFGCRQNLAEARACTFRRKSVQKRAMAPPCAHDRVPKAGLLGAR